MGGAGGVAVVPPCCPLQIQELGELAEELREKLSKACDPQGTHNQTPLRGLCVLCSCVHVQVLCGWGGGVDECACVGVLWKVG